MHGRHWALEDAAQALLLSHLALENAVQASLLSHLALKNVAQALLLSRSALRATLKEAVHCDTELCFTSLCSALLCAWICTGSHLYTYIHIFVHVCTNKQH